MESLKKMFELENDLSYIKDFHYVFQTKNISLNYPVAETEKGSYLPIVIMPWDIQPLLEFLHSNKCISRIDYDTHRQDDILVDIEFKYDTADTSIRKICNKAIQIIKEIVKNKKEEC